MKKLGLTIYESNLLIIAIFAAVCYFLPDKKHRKITFIFLTTLTMLIIQGFRAHTVGGDLFTYYTNYSWIKYEDFSVIFNQRFEIGYGLFSYIYSNLNISFQVFIFTISLFNLTLLGIFVYKYSEYPVISYMLYAVLSLYDFNFSGLRQSIAMSITLVGFHFIMKNKWVQFLFTIIIASLFHRTAIILLLLYPVINTKFRNTYKKLYIVIIIFIYLFADEIIRYIFSAFGTGRLFSFGGIGNDELFILFIFVAGLILNKIKKNNKLFENLLLLVSISLIIQLLSTYHYFFARFNYYFSYYIIIFVPMLFKEFLEVTSMKNKYQRFLIQFFMVIFFVILSLYYFNSRLRTNPHQILPHIFFWEL